MLQPRPDRGKYRMIRVIHLGQEPGDIDRFLLARDQRFAVVGEAPAIRLPITTAVSPFEDDEEACIESRPEESLDVDLILAMSDPAAEPVPVALSSSARRRKNALHPFGHDPSASVPLAAVVGHRNGTTQWRITIHLASRARS